MPKRITHKLVQRTYLTLTEQPVIKPLEKPEAAEIAQLQNPTVSFYLYLYREVGAEFGWADRLILTPEELTTIICNPLVDIYVIHVGGVPAGYAEIDRRNPEEYVLVFFGLIREFRGKGLGKYFLQWIIQKAFEGKPQKLSLDTMDQDHPQALPNYLKAGFQIVDQRTEKQTVLLED